MVRNQFYAAQFMISIFSALTGGNEGVAATPAPKGLYPQNFAKKLAHVGVFLGHLLS